jgi:hypothetical protein
LARYLQQQLLLMLKLCSKTPQSVASAMAKRKETVMGLAAALLAEATPVCEEVKAVTADLHQQCCASQCCCLVVHCRAAVSAACLQLIPCHL